MKSILFYIYIKEIIGRIMNMYTLKENMRSIFTYIYNKIKMYLKES